MGGYSQTCRVIGSLSRADGIYHCTALTPLRAVIRLAPQSNGAIAQLGERYNGIVEVGGSIPPGSTIIPRSNKLPKFRRPHRLEA